MEYVSINPIQIEALDLSPAKKPHQLVAFRVLTSVHADRQVSAFFVGCKQLAVSVTDVLTTLTPIDTPDDIAV